MNAPTLDGIVIVAAPLTPRGARTRVDLFAMESGQIQVCSRTLGTDHLVVRQQVVSSKDAQKFYEQLLVQVGYETPRVKLREIFKGRLSVRRSEHLVAGRVRTDHTLSCRVVGAGHIRVSFGPKRALELAHALSDPLGWELED